MSRAGLPRLLGLAGAVVLAVPFPRAAAQTAAAPAVPQPCAACHLPSGAGVPGAFPPLRENFRAFAATLQGRRYVILVVTHGLTGPLTVDGKRFNGVMPAQALRDEDVARTLNVLLAPGQRPFTAREVAAIRASGSSLSSAQIAALRPSATAR